MELLELSIIC